MGNNLNILLLFTTIECLLITNNKSVKLGDW